MILWKLKKRNRWWPVTILVSIIYRPKKEELLEKYLRRLGFSNFKANPALIYSGWGKVALIRVLRCLIWLIGLRWICLVMIFRKIIKWCQRMALFSHRWRFQDQIRLLFSRHLRVLSRFQLTAIIQELILWSHFHLHQRFKLLIHQIYSWVRVDIS